MKARGFTLIEVMITVAIIGILAAIALPSYDDYVKRGQIQDGTNVLMATQSRMEQYFQDNKTYAGFTCPAATKYFAYSGCVGANATTYTLTASGTGNLAGFSYTIDQSSTQTSATPWGNGANCWVLKKGGC